MGILLVSVPQPVIRGHMDQRIAIPQRHRKSSRLPQIANDNFESEKVKIWLLRLVSENLQLPDELGTGFGHLAIGVPDIYGTCAQLAKEGVKIPRPPGPMKHGTTVIAFIEDPDGYKIELIQRS